MAYDLAAMRLHFRFLIRDPAARALTDLQVLGYLNSAKTEWVKRMERRPGATLGSFTYTANATSTIYLAEVDAGSRLETLSVGGVPLVRAEFNRVRFLQETEGQTGTPRTFGAQLVQETGQPNQTWVVALYPIPTVNTSVTLKGTDILVLFPDLAFDTDQVRTDYATARWITRIAAHRAGLDLGLDAGYVKRIVAGLGTWMESCFRRDKTNHDLQLRDEDSPLFREVWPNA